MTDETTEQSSLPGRWKRKANAAGAVVVLTAVAALAYAAGRGAGPSVGDDRPTDSLVGQAPAAAAPAWPVQYTRVPPATRVIGVRAGGKYRAYAVSALTEVSRHIYNDLLGGVPVTVAYCDRTDCVRAFTASGRTDPLDLAVAGWSQADGMLVRVGRFRYTQLSGRAVDAGAPPFAYQPMEVERTTWGSWVAAHPDTDLVGD